MVMAYIVMTYMITAHIVMTFIGMAKRRSKAFRQACTRAFAQVEYMNSMFEGAENFNQLLGFNLGVSTLDYTNT